MIVKFSDLPAAGIPVHGLIGYNLFQDYIVRIDYEMKLVLPSRKPIP